MPAWRLVAEAKQLARFDVVGHDSAKRLTFVSHAGLAAEPRDAIAAGAEIRQCHMRPPLARDDKYGPVQVIATAALTADEVNQVQTFVDEHANEYAAQRVSRRNQYRIRPHMEIVKDDDGTEIYRRFNCAGFVIEAYRYCGVEFVVTNEDLLPDVSLQTLKDAYPAYLANLDNAAFRSQQGIPGDGGWRVILPGYIFNALNRTAAEIRTQGPYRPVAGDEIFPSAAPPPGQTAGIGQ